MSIWSAKMHRALCNLSAIEMIRAAGAMSAGAVSSPPCALSTTSFAANCRCPSTRLRLPRLRLRIDGECLALASGLAREFHLDLQLHRGARPQLPEPRCRRVRARVPPRRAGARHTGLCCPCALARDEVLRRTAAHFQNCRTKLAPAGASFQIQVAL